MNPEIRVLLADDHPMVREGLKASLDGEGGIRIVAEAENGVRALALAAKLKPAVVMLDISMPVMGGLEAAEAFAREYPKIKVLALTMHEDREYVLKMMQLGVAGYVLKNVDAEEIILAIQTVFRGGTFFSAGASEQLFARMHKPPTQNQLTEREKTVLGLMAEGLCNKEIAERLNISVRTAEAHRQNMRKKLNIKTSTGLVRYALKVGVGSAYAAH